jgi:hypothetical protein
MEKKAARMKGGKEILHEGINKEREEKCVNVGRKVMYNKRLHARKNTAEGNKDGRKTDG